MKQKNKKSSIKEQMGDGLMSFFLLHRTPAFSVRKAWAMDTLSWGKPGGFLDDTKDIKESFIYIYSKQLVFMWGKRNGPENKTLQYFF